MSRAARTGTRLAILVTAILLIGASVAVASGTLDPNRSRLVSANQALADFAQFDPSRGSKASVGKVLSGALGDAYEIRGEDVHALIDVHDGRVVMYRLLDAAATPLASPMSTVDATVVAAEFLSSHGISVDGLGEPTSQLQDHGSSQAIVVIWQRVNAAGVLMPDQRVVEIDPSTGEVTGFLDLRRPYVDPAPAGLTKSEAAVAAQAATGLTNVESAHLAITFGPTGTQILVWRVTLAESTGGTTSTAAVDIDAATGTVVNDSLTP